jgi:hypothetical protein
MESLGVQDLKTDFQCVRNFISNFTGVDRVANAVTNIEKGVESLTKEVKELKTEIKDLTNEVSDLKKERAFIKCMEGIQDLNSEELLETKTEFKVVKDDLIDLRDYRNGTCHYLNRRDSPEQKKNKKNQLLFALQHMSNETREMFDRQFGDKVITYIINYMTTCYTPEPLTDVFWK